MSQEGHNVLLCSAKSDRQVLVIHVTRSKFQDE